MEYLLIGAALAGLVWLYFSRRRAGKPAIWFDDVILRPEDLYTHAAKLANFHKTVPARFRSKKITRRLQDNFRLITQIYKEASEDLRKGRGVAPAGEWLLDNYYIIEEQVREILLSGKSRRFHDLPVLGNGRLKGSPRIYAVIMELIGHTDGKIDESLMVNFINAYQEQAPLSIAEIWALSLLLRIALVEKILYSCQQLATTHSQWRLAEDLLIWTHSEKVSERIEEMGQLEPSFVEHLLEILRNDERDGKEIREVLAAKLLDQDTTLEKVVNSEHQAEAARATSLGNAISSLKNASTLDWNNIFEALCPVDKILEGDRVYTEMDFESRNYYRLQIQRLAKKASVSETRVARLLMECTRDRCGLNGHCGYYLLDQGRGELYRKLGRRGQWAKYDSRLYILSVVILSMAAATAAGSYAYSASPTLAGAGALLFLIPVSEVIVNLLNRVLVRIKLPAFLPKLEYRQGIPKEAATLVVVPALLTDRAKTLELVERLEVHYLANPEENLYFALLGDYKDAPAQEAEGDEEIRAAALAGVEELNKKYGRRFFPLLRRRSFSQTQGKWMGWERKRGALVELNALLKGGTETTFTDLPTQLPRVRYILTLDADTRLPIDMAKKLVGTISHPLNQLVVDGANKQVLRGYGIIQPRIGVSVESVSQTLFARVMAGQGGIDTYTTAISDVYQDWFGQGIFTGKGIYDLDGAAEILPAIPENSILSHDLLEGGLLRTGLATDLELVDDFPCRYNSYMQRQHRWTRGDWQLLPWLRGKVAGSTGRNQLHPLNTLTRWQIFDNLRRSLVPVSLILFLAAGLTVLPGKAIVWAGLFFAALVLPYLSSLLAFNWSAYLQNLAAKTPAPILIGPRAVAWQIGLQLAFLPYQAWLHGDAILRTLYRLLVSRKNLLEWTTAAEVEKKIGDDYSRRFLPALAAALALAGIVAAVRPRSLVIYGPLLAIWLAAPILAKSISSPDQDPGPALSGEELKLLRKIARRTWYYYQDLTGEQSSHLPPDNYQISPPNGIDFRTSPTNIGFYLISALAARDFGFISTLEMVKRIGQTLTSVEKLRKWKGHLFNWYDTRDLELLRPWFVSTVDSGNFVGMLIVLAQGLKEYLARPLVDAGSLLSLRDLFVLDTCPLPDEITLPQWAELISELETAKKHGRRGREFLDMFREELDTLFPHTEILNSPPAFLQEDNYSDLAALVRSVLEQPTPANLSRQYKSMLAAIEEAVSRATPEQYEYLLVLKDDLQRVAPAAAALEANIRSLTGRIENLIAEADFSALYNSKRHLFAVGYSVDEEKLTDSSYDLLASEARLTSYLGIVGRHVPVKHWYKTGRAVTKIDGARALVSWAGTMFEYLMPPLLMRNYDYTLLAEAVNTVITAQIQYGAKRNLPWGVSESGYYGFDYRLNYQYRAFGIPDLGLKRGLVDDIVVSSYSTLLALPFAPRQALDNIEKLLDIGLGGEYGLFEAVDYTPTRLPGGEKQALVKSYMAHHQGMGFIALANYLNDFATVSRFHRHPRIKAGELLLQERIPLQPILTKQIQVPVLPLQQKEVKEEEVVRSFGAPQALPPNCHLLSNGSYTVLLTDSGSGYSKNEQVQINRWREDALGYKYGTFIFVKNLNNDRVWSSTYAPFQKKQDFYRVRFKQDRASYFIETKNIDTRTDIIVSTEDNAEIRQVTLTNHGTKTYSLEITSFLELALSHQSADLAHPTFNNLFVQTELLPEQNCLLAARRPRGDEDQELFALHLLTVQGETVGSLQYETDRAKFLGRGNAISNPVALHQPLSNSLGPVLDPIFSLRQQIKLGPGRTAILTYVTAQGSNRAEMIRLAEKYNDTSASYRAFDLAAARSIVERRFLNLSANLLEASQQALGHLLFLSPARRKYGEILARNPLGQRALWAQGISGDNPIVLVNIDDTDDINIVAEAIRAHEYWRFKGLIVDLVILNGEEGGYLEPVRELIRETVQLSQVSEIMERPGGIYVRNVKQLTEDEQALFHGAARLILKGGKTLRQQLESELPSFPGKKEFSDEETAFQDEHYDPSPSLLFFNGYGGFSRDGSEYVIALRQRTTPAPWINVIANPNFGFTVSERGAGFTFAENSRENKLTPWSNDPVSDPPGEIIYLRDEQTGAVWSATAAPLREPATYSISHGFGYSRFAHHSHGLEQQLTMLVPPVDPVKISLLKLKNHAPRQRQLTITYYVRPVLGVSDQVSQQHLITAREGNLITVRNPYNGDFPGRVVWVGASEPLLGYTGDRVEFLGLEGSLARPAALNREGLSGAVGAGLDPCAALQILIDLAPGEEKEVVLQLGQAPNKKIVQEIADKYSPAGARKALDQVRKYWRRVTGSISVKTPEPSLNLILPWLLYQTLVCRLWARSGFYQSGGAYGFRDQLQDAMNLALVAPQLTREQILLHAAHQFREGDVQHWWHPGTNNRGVRTRFSDDLLWLPYATAEYIEKTGDQAILEERVPFLHAPPLAPGEDDRYGEAEVSEEAASLYVHCLRAIERALKFGRHGLPLMGSGDWNDGMNTVGNQGKGESVWLGWFLYSILQRFAPFCRAKGDDGRTEFYLQKARDIAAALETNGWDGRWYRRAYFDDGTPLGAAENPECSIDSIAQSWAVISGGGRRDRAEEAMAAVESHLIQEDKGLILLFTPPFADSALKPGYIKSYLPGVRENGGQYTHAACWVIQAMAMLGKGDKALKLLALINPVNHSRTTMECFTYKTEPYVLAADVYSVHPHAGRGGWTWYTGAAGWLYRVCLEYILGLKRQGNLLLIEPCIPGEWKEYTLNYRFGKSVYTIQVLNPQGISTGVGSLTVDGQPCKLVNLVDDGKTHYVKVQMGI